MVLLTKIIGIFILGLIGGSIPGPIIASSFTEALHKGFSGSLKVIFRALVAESIVALAILVIFRFLNLPETYFHIISLGGVVVLAWLAWQVWKIEKFNDPKSDIFSFSKIFLLTILNGGFIIFWITICIPMAFDLGNFIKGGPIVFLIIFELGWLASISILTFIFSKFRPLLLRKNLVSAVFKIFALILAYFAVETAFTSIIFLVK